MVPLRAFNESRPLPPTPSLSNDLLGGGTEEAAATAAAASKQPAGRAGVVTPPSKSGTAGLAASSLMDERKHRLAFKPGGASQPLVEDGRLQPLVEARHAPPARRTPSLTEMMTRRPSEFMMMQQAFAEEARTVDDEPLYPKGGMGGSNSSPATRQHAGSMQMRGSGRGGDHGAGGRGASGVRTANSAGELLLGGRPLGRGGSSERLLMGSLVPGRSSLPYDAHYGHIKRGSVSRALAKDGLASLIDSDARSGAALVEGWWSKKSAGNTASGMGRSSSMPKMAMPRPPSLPALR